MTTRRLWLFSAEELFRNEPRAGHATEADVLCLEILFDCQRRATNSRNTFFAESRTSRQRAGATIDAAYSVVAIRKRACSTSGSKAEPLSRRSSLGSMTSSSSIRRWPCSASAQNLHQQIIMKHIAQAMQSTTDRWLAQKKAGLQRGRRFVSLLAR